MQGQQAITTTSIPLIALVTTASAPTTTASASLTFTITLTISRLTMSNAPLPGATLGSAYTATVTASGGLQPYPWSVEAGSLPTGLNLGAASGTISGTPTATGTFVFTVKVSDAESSPMTLSSGFTLTVSTSSTVNSPAPSASFTLCGSNVFGIQGFVGTTGPAVMAASFVADNSGHVVSGVEDISSISGGQANVTITGGSYSVGADGRGVLTLIDSNGVSRTFRFVLESAANFGAAAIEEFDTSGTLAAGPMLGPLPPPFATMPGDIGISQWVQLIRSILNVFQVQGCEEILDRGDNIRDAEWLLESAWLAWLGRALALFHQITSHEDHCRLAIT